MQAFAAVTMDSPSTLVRLLHSVPHVNITLHRVNSTFNPSSDIYIEVSWFCHSHSDACMRMARRRSIISSLTTISARCIQDTHTTNTVNIQFHSKCRSRSGKLKANKKQNERKKIGWEIRSKSAYRGGTDPNFRADCDARK